MFFESKINQIINKKSFCIRLIVVLITSMSEFLSIEISVAPIGIIVKRNLFVQIAGFFVILGINLLIRFFLNRKSYLILMDLFSFILCLAFPLISYYAYKLHGTPFTLSDIKNAKTAMGVIDSYWDEILLLSKRHVIWLFAFLCNVFIAHVTEKQLVFVSIRRERVIESFIIFFIAVYISWAFIGLIPEKMMGKKWNYVANVHSNGYIICLINSSILEANAVKEPEAYSKERAQELMSENKKDGNDKRNRPDIIVILNETFYDINKSIYVENSEEPITYIKNVESGICGYAVVPNAGGGTNMSEWELLTGNSMALLQDNITPFQNLDLFNANSVVSMLKENGYSTLAAHCCPGENYNRLNAYPEMGFDQVKFVDDFYNLRGWANRKNATDESVYENVLNWYSEMGDGPRLVYILTYQNHGAWNANEPKQNPIQVLDDYGEYTNQLSEFNSSIYYSDKAISKILDYVNDRERDVIVVMVGDHCPSIMYSIIEEYYPDCNTEERELNLRSVPFFVWSNNSNLLDESMESETFSLLYLLPKVLDGADTRISGWFKYLSEMSKHVPVLTKYGIYYDKSWEMHSYDEATSNSELINDYFSLEYTNIKTDMDNEFFR